MRRNLLIAVFSALAGLTLAVLTDTDRVEASATAPEPLRLVVFEVAGCAYCKMFKEQVEPVYAGTAQSRLAPLEYVDVGRGEPGEFKTVEPITVAPTVVLFRGNREVDRIPGYSGPQTFLALVDEMVAASR